MTDLTQSERDEIREFLERPFVVAILEKREKSLVNDALQEQLSKKDRQKRLNKLFAWRDLILELKKEAKKPTKGER